MSEGGPGPAAGPTSGEMAAPSGPLDVGLVAQNVVRRDGQGRVMMELARALLARGHEVTVHAHRLDDQLSSRVTFRRLPRVPGPQLLDDLVTIVGASLRLRRHRHDVVCVLGPTALPPAPFVFNVQFSHAGWRSTWTPETRPGLYHRLHAAVLARLEASVARRADRIISSTEVLAREVLPGASERTVVVPNGIDLDEFEPADDAARRVARERFGAGQDDFVVAFLGGWSTPRKGLDPLLEALTRGPSSERLLLAHRGPRAALDARLTALGLRDRVIVAGFAPPRDVFAAADVACVPSLYEPFSLVGLEAAACSLPVVISGRAGAAPLLGGGAVVVEDPEDASALRRALDGVRTDPEMARRLGAAARRAVEGLTWSALFPEAARAVEDAAAVPARG